MKPCDSNLIKRATPLVTILALTVLLPLRLWATGEERFDTPEAAVQTLTTAVSTKDTNAMRAIFGPTGRELVSPDVVQAGEEYRAFVKRLAEKAELVHESDSKATLQLGSDGWPFPIPLVKQDGKWFFDTQAGKEEILRRRVGMDEIDTIRVCRAYVDAQREYASKDRNGDEVLEYAQLLRSTPGQHDGLYWSARGGGELSPLGPLIAQARWEGYRRPAKMMSETQAPYHGYYFKILTRQGRHAPGGKYNYIINGHMIAGFALVAWPAQWGNTGVMTFIVNQQGKVFQKNLGSKTAAIASSMKAYDPGTTWTSASDD